MESAVLVPSATAWPAVGNAYGTDARAVSVISARVAVRASWDCARGAPSALSEDSPPPQPATERRASACATASAVRFITNFINDVPFVQSWFEQPPSRAMPVNDGDEGDFSAGFGSLDATSVLVVDRTDPARQLARK